MKRYEQLNGLLGETETPEDMALKSTITYFLQSKCNFAKGCETVEDVYKTINTIAENEIQNFKTYYRRHLEWLKEEIE